jgi:hypothetical protein
MQHVVSMVHIDEHVLDVLELRLVTLLNGVEKHVREAPQLAQAVHLMEQCHAVDHAPRGILSWR